MSDKPLVSTIIPFYNTPEQFLQEAIESVFAQTYQNWEILLVDDGSDGICSDIARYYDERYPAKVRYLDHHGHQNRGLSASRNLGVEHSKGKYIAFLDADDVWLPMKLEKQVTILTSQPKAGMVYGKSQYWWSWTRNPEDIDRDRIQEHGIKGDTLLMPPNLLRLFLEGKALLPCPCSIMVRRELLERIGGFEVAHQSSTIAARAKTLDEKQTIFSWINNLYEDQIFYAKVCLENSVFVSNECWDRYRQHPGSLIARANRQQSRLARLTYLEWLEEYLRKKGFRDNRVWRSLQIEKWCQRNPSVGNRFKRAKRIVWRLKGTYPRCQAK
jgi:glycosyltransferase involved in cell wall biosynthesis